MRSLILKVFLCYWIAAGCVIVATDLFPHEQMHRPEVAVALASLMRLQSRGLIAAYEAGGCPAAEPLLVGPQDRLYLAGNNGGILCDAPPVPDLRGLALKAAHSSVPVASNFRNFQLVALSIRSVSGKPYLLLLKNNYTTPFNFFGLAVGPTTVWISAGVTLLFGILVAVPIRRVRSAAREIANGRLDTRVRLGWLYERVPRIAGEDVLSGLAADFNHMADRLEFLADAQRTLFRDISHELRSPLARLSVARELAREVGPSSMRAPLDRIENEAARVNDLVGQLLTLSRMENMRELGQQVELSLRDLVEYLLPDLEYEAVGRRRTVVTRTMQECIVSGDPVMLQRAFENIVRNAISYTPEQGIVEIDLKRAERNGVEVGILQIADNGPGVPAHELQSILRPFYRSDKSRQPSTGGFGVGLAIASRAVKLHAGQISISNRPEGGLLVEMTFPVV
jgi:two-component system sensor histidine kinase CpxA